MENNKVYDKVYDFTNENVHCLKDLYHFENSKVITVLGSGDQYFASKLHGAKQVDVFDINTRAYLYFILKFYAIRELTYEEFYDFFINKNLKNRNIYDKLEPVLPKEALYYYKYLIKTCKTKLSHKKCFKRDGIELLTKENQIYYFDKEKPIIPYLIKDEDYRLQEILKKSELPMFYHSNFVRLKKQLNDNYDIMLLSNIYNSLRIYVETFTKMLEEYDIPEIEACYDWNGWYLNAFKNYNYKISNVHPSSPAEYNRNDNYVYSLYR